PLAVLWLLLSCRSADATLPMPLANPEIPLHIPERFPPVHKWAAANKPTQYGVQLGKKSFHEQKFSGNHTMSCASCHNQSTAFADTRAQARGVHGRVGLRNTPPIQNLAFMQFYNWDGNILQLE